MGSPSLNSDTYQFNSIVFFFNGNQSIYYQRLRIRKNSLSSFIANSSIFQTQQADLRSEDKYNLNFDPSSKFHSIQPTAQIQISPLQQSFYGYNGITPTRLVQEKSHSSTIPGRNIPVCIVSEDKQNNNLDPSSKFHSIQPAGQAQVSLLQQSYYGHNCITPTRLVEEKSHPSTMPGRNILMIWTTPK